VSVKSAIGPMSHYTKTESVSTHSMTAWYQEMSVPKNIPAAITEQIVTC